jgi:SSS family solute:Na+ symporter
MADFGLLNWMIVAAYMLGNLYLGFKMSGRIRSAEQYYIGDKSAPWWAIGISVMATYVSALSFLGGPAWAYGDGMARNYILLRERMMINYQYFHYRLSRRLQNLYLI